MTLNSFTSMSLDPLLVSRLLAHDTRTLGVVRKSAGSPSRSSPRAAADGARLCPPRRRFPPPSRPPTAYGFYPVREAPAELYCDVHEVVTAGDHDLVIGHVVEFLAGQGEPLVFHGGQFGGVDPDKPAPGRFIDFLDEGIGW